MYILSVADKKTKIILVQNMEKIELSSASAISNRPQHVVICIYVATQH